MNVELSKDAAQAIVYAINFHLEDQGLDRIPQARALAILVAAEVKRVVTKEFNPEPLLGVADVWHQGTKQHYRARFLEKITPEQFYFDPTEEFGG